MISNREIIGQDPFVERILSPVKPKPGVNCARTACAFFEQEGTGQRRGACRALTSSARADSRLSGILRFTENGIHPVFSPENSGPDTCPGPERTGKWNI